MLPLLCAFAPYPKLTLVPVPLHPLRLANRGYNQSALLAGALAFRANVGYAPRTLARVSEGPKQAQLSRSERQALNADRFLVVKAPSTQVLLIDDVLTTGSTARACIEALERRNVQVAGVLTFAQA
jgi:predicted amidophosphoribosyltransferase